MTNHMSAAARAEWTPCACGKGRVHRDDLQGYPEVEGDETSHFRRVCVDMRDGFLLTFRSGRTRMVDRFPEATLDAPPPPRDLSGFTASDLHAEHMAAYRANDTARALAAVNEKARRALASQRARGVDVSGWAGQYLYGDGSMPRALRFGRRV